ncbi:hypothetical protein CHS0354_033337 [Potamilus streckersoni]|uniref:EGF domain-specific O-linked N-acetylglucosamine transferase n=1 Tax=Potamilus streckersoni TaxID=2493646 RepID=A0AAE0RTI3_9BIVA|nr:hypothetical protein CHS0354_033337 [Potamilus streckersoni]
MRLTIRRIIITVLASLGILLLLINTNEKFKILKTFPFGYDFSPFNTSNLHLPISHFQSKRHFHEYQNIYFNEEFKVDKGFIAKWSQDGHIHEICDGNLKSFGWKFARLHNVVMDAREFHSSPVRGGRSLYDHITSGDVKINTYWNLKPEFWKLYCRKKETLSLDSEILKSMPFAKALSIETLSKSEVQVILNDNETLIYSYKNVDIPAGKREYVTKKENITVVPGFTIAIFRDDYWNLHQYTMHCFHIFLMMMYYKKTPEQTTLLVVDGHPIIYNYEMTWKKLVGSVVRAAEFDNRVLFKDLVWSIAERYSPLYQYDEEKEYFLEEYRNFYLQQHGLNITSYLDCRKVKITVILRRDYVCRLGDISGHAERKIFNEGEVLYALRHNFPDAIVKGRLFDSMPMEDQLAWIRNTDILIGMHGAGMTHSIYLPNHAAMFEMFPLDFKNGRPWYCVYESVARWRELKYLSWTNNDPKIEIDGGYINIPIDVLVANVKILHDNICKSH